MLVIALAIVVIPLAWLAIRSARRWDPATRRAVVACAIPFLLVPLALRAGPAFTGLLVAVTVASFAIWLRRRGSGGNGGDDGRDPPAGPDPDPDPGDLAVLPPTPLDGDAFDRARADWENELPKRS